MGSGSGLLVVVAGGRSGSQGDGGMMGSPDFKKHLYVSMMNLNFTFSLICFYIAMVMTNWGYITNGDNVSYESVSITSGSVSMYMAASAAWIVIILYIFALIMPDFGCFPKEVWNLEFKKTNNPTEVEDDK
jgi:hypothetical protein